MEYLLYCPELDKEGVCKGLALNLYMDAVNLSITFKMIRSMSMNSVGEGFAVVCQAK